jgi:hypothetical protein
MCLMRHSTIATPRVRLAGALAIWFAFFGSSMSGRTSGAESRDGLYTFQLHGGHFFGPGPIVPDTALPDGRLTNIRFDFRTWRGICLFENDENPKSRLSDGTTRINQNIDAGRLFVGGGSSPILLTAVDGGPHRGREEYSLDDQYRMVWHVDIALDSGFPEGIIRLNDFVLTTGVARITQSQQTQRGEPGGYDQAGTLTSGTFIVGRLGDFDQDGFLDGVLVAAPTVPMEADMLPGAPVGNQRGFRTNLPVSPGVSLELILRGLLELRDPIETLVGEGDHEQLQGLIDEAMERVRAARLNLQRAMAESGWNNHRASSQIRRLGPSFDHVALNLQRLQELTHLGEAPSGERTTKLSTDLEGFSQLSPVIEQVSEINDQSPSTLPRPLATGQHGHAERAIDTH